MADPAHDLNVAIQHQMRGELEEAEAIYRAILREEPQNRDAFHLLGVAAYQGRRYNQAIELISTAIAIDKSNPAFFCNLGLAYAGTGDYDLAITHFQEALRLYEPYPEAHNNLGNIYKEQGRLEEAAQSYQQALSFRPESPETLYNLGSIFQEEGKVAEAMECYQKALALMPQSAEICSNLSVLYKDTGDYEMAAEYAFRAIELKPGYLDGYLNLGLIFKTVGLSEKAISFYDQALAISPGSIEALWGRCMALIPILYDSNGEILKRRNSYRDSLHELNRLITLDTKENIDVAARLAGAAQPFYLPYQGRVDKVLQSAYGNLVSRIQAARYPETSGAMRLRRHAAKEKIRVGIVSGFFYYHSNWKIPIKGWVENIDRSRFSLYGYYTGYMNDDVTATARVSFDRFVEGTHSFRVLRDAILSDSIDVLIYPEIGMDAMTVRLAALRLAPVQCTSWGHPNTSGLPTIDYFLSSDLMEPEEGEDHYSEELVRLPNLSIHYTPISRGASSLTRADFGLPEEKVVYFCAQSLFKYLPQYDDLFPRIAREAGECRFVFLSYKRSKELTERFLARIERAFSKYSIDCSTHVVMLPQLDPLRYHAMNRLSDVFLDSIGWSGCNTTLEAIECDLPVVTLPGNLMRGRHTYGIMKMMGVTDTIAETEDEYVECAVRLGTDRSLRDRVRTAFSQRKQYLYYDTEPVKALEVFLKKTTGRLP
ncbi:MAG TPA: tetratricopeptide repeat protein [Syntrophorhabdaceae bacterium]